MIRALPVMAQKQADAAAAVVERRDGSVRGLRDAALLAVMSDGLLRVSEAAALEVADLEAEDANTLTIRRSKTDQEAEGAVQYIGEPTVARVRAWLDAAGIAAGPLFQGLDRAGRPRGRPAPCPSGPSSSDAPPRPGSRAACPATRYRGRQASRRPPDREEPRPPSVGSLDGQGRPRSYPTTSDGVNAARPDSRRSLLHSGHFGTIQSDVLQWQEGQIVQSCLNLDDFLP